GTVSPADELAIGDGNTAASSLFLVNGGLLNAQAVGFENEAGHFFPMLKVTGGTLTVGDISWFGAAPGTGTPRFIMSGGKATVSGSVFNDPATTVDLFMHITGTASLSLNGAVTLINATDSLLQSGQS